MNTLWGHAAGNKLLTRWSISSNSVNPLALSMALPSSMTIEAQADAFVMAFFNLVSTFIRSTGLSVVCVLTKGISTVLDIYLHNYVNDMEVKCTVSSLLCCVDYMIQV